MSARFYEEPSKETYKDYMDELELTHREGLISYSDMEYIKAAALRVLKERGRNEG